MTTFYLGSSITPSSAVLTFLYLYVFDNLISVENGDISDLWQVFDTLISDSSIEDGDGVFATSLLDKKANSMLCPKRKEHLTFITVINISVLIAT